MEFTFDNVNDAFPALVRLFASPPAGRSQDRHTQIVATPSRAGDVLMVPEPVIVTYRQPLQRVLFNQARDANPFFHLFESLWMLAGRNDIAPLKYYVSTMGDFSDDGKTMNGAYGYRWRQGLYWKANYSVQTNTFEDTQLNPEGTYLDRDEPGVLDQLAWIVDHLRKDPTSRRAVLQMWNVEDDLLKIDSSKDVCCNSHVYFSIRDQQITLPNPGLSDQGESNPVKLLDMTVCNRSNDLIWGMLGTNVVHFSFLQEYMAACIGVEVGRYTQFTNNLHVYKGLFEPDKWLEEYDNRTMHSPPRVEYEPSWTHVSLIKNSARFDKECATFIGCTLSTAFCEPFLISVAQPMMAAFAAHKRLQYLGDHGAFHHIDRVADGAWQAAGESWIQCRYNNHVARVDSKDKLV